MKKLIFILPILLCLQTSGKESLFKKANEEYKNQKYTNAISLYDSIVSNNLESSELYYNLGNCYYKTQDWANAIWYYEKSLLLKKNKNTLQNLELAKLNIIDKIEPLPQLFYKKWWQKLLNLLPIKTWQIFTLLSIWMVLILKIVTKFTNYKKTTTASYFLNSLTLILVWITYSCYEKNYNKNEAIIFSSSVSVNSAPTEEIKNLFSLHAGTKIEIIDEIDDWIKIKLADGKNGWIKKSVCKTLE